MTPTAATALFFAMVLLALIPGPGVLIVTARAMSGGLLHGALATAGVVAGDYVFIALAILGLVTLSSVLGELFIIIKYIGAAYLVWLGISLMRAPVSGKPQPAAGSPNRLASFLTGLITTLGNPKAILFYISFFPAFLDLERVSLADAVIVYAITTVAIGGVMFGYAVAAVKAKSALSNTAGIRALRMGSGSILLGSGIYVATR